MKIYAAFFNDEAVAIYRLDQKTTVKRRLSFFRKKIYEYIWTKIWTFKRDPLFLYCSTDKFAKELRRDNDIELVRYHTHLNEFIPFVEEDLA